MAYRTGLVIFLWMATLAVFGQPSIEGIVKDAQSGEPLPAASILLPESEQSTSTKIDGHFKINTEAGKKVRLKCFYLGYDQLDTVVAANEKDLVLELKSRSMDLKTVDIRDERTSAFGMSRLRSIEGTAIYAGKKTDVIEPAEMNANLATNNARQVFSKIAGLNIWESDGAGIQLGIGVRGLSPNRTSNINVRQNGYDISADALGYPESYYTPPMEALERIEYVRGAASLQYGTQFGGMMNFVLKDGPEDDPLEVVTRQTAGSFGLFNSFNSIGGTQGNSQYYGFIHYKRGDGWRENAGYDVLTGHASYSYDLSEKLSIGFEYTGMKYLAQQPGGLTEQQFEEDPRESYRDRNWFQVEWNLAAIDADWEISPSTRLNTRFFGLLANRKALGYLGETTRLDEPGTPRDLIWGDFKNVGNETRLLHRYRLAEQQSALLVGFRLYKGNNRSRQGMADRGDGADFRFLEEQGSVRNDYDHDNFNAAAFAENVFYLGEKFTVTPGVRFEYIDTRANGYYSNVVRDLNGNIIELTEFQEDRARQRSILLAGLGMSYKPNAQTEVYGNLSQNYRAINFSDMRINNPSFRIDPNLSDERGYNADIGIRGRIGQVLNYDLSAYMLMYSNRIGSVQRRDLQTYRVYRLRTNVADSRSTGVEVFGEFSPMRLFRSIEARDFQVTVFSSFSYNNAVYLSSDEPAFDGNQVELVPEITSRSGISAYAGEFKATLQYSYVSEQYTEATNTEYTSNAVNGLIPAYGIFDLSGTYNWRNFTVEAGVNNLMDEKYFTRRAAGYPGPGIIPSEGRSFYVTLGAKF